MPAKVVGLNLEATVNELLLACAGRRRGIAAQARGRGAGVVGRVRDKGGRGDAAAFRHSAKNIPLTRVRRGLSHLVHLAILQNLEQRGLAGAVEPEKEHLGILVVQACARGRNGNRKQALAALEPPDRARSARKRCQVAPKKLRTS